MLFNSILFLLFFIIVTVTYYLLNPRFRWIWLLAASCYFYMYFMPVYILIIFFTIIVDYAAGLLIEASDKKTTKRFFLILSLIANIGMLAYYKYFDFLAENLNFITRYFKGPQIPFLNIILPIGLSFHTFQAMSYTIEVYRGKQPAEKHFGIYSLYVLFYPQMVAGPIERPQNILPQLHAKNKYNYNNIVSGLYVISIGLFKKVVIADRLGLYVDPVFNSPKSHSSLELIIATYCFALQIYCDFSGYSDIAIGSAKTLGINLMDNFNMPYMATNISEFWKRWHISLSTWFRDYLYIPLGGNRVSFLITCINLLFVFMISGLWHGANWKYIIWGLAHGFFLIIYHVFKKLNIKLKGFNWLKWLITFNFVCFTWIFFRANTVTDAFLIFSKIFTGNSFTYKASSIMSLNELYYCLLMIIALLTGEHYLRTPAELSSQKKTIIAIALFIGCYFLGVFNEAQFIYFQF
jgi:alginate O-acetyltransferase complex protein AlgI